MKKVLTLITAATITAAFVACGPSKAEIEAKEKAKADSTRVADSLAGVEKMKAEAEKRAQDSIAAAAEKMKTDSIAKADSLAKAKGGKKK
ncbi:MAG: hypothetical protein JSU07_06675 [Bacteroidetes bacterium]|nr:hypothetical protein [Bacteroidota bacterium]